MRRDGNACPHLARKPDSQLAKNCNTDHMSQSCSGYVGEDCIGGGGAHAAHRMARAISSARVNVRRIVSPELNVITHMNPSPWYPSRPNSLNSGQISGCEYLAFTDPKSCDARHIWAEDTSKGQQPAVSGRRAFHLQPLFLPSSRTSHQAVAFLVTQSFTREMPP